MRSQLFVAVVALFTFANVSAQRPPIPVLAAPLADVQLKAEAGTVVYIGDRAHLAEAAAVKKTSATLTLSGNPADLEVVVSRWVVANGEVEELVGESHLVSDPDAKDLEYRIEVATEGRWRVEVINYKTRRRSVQYVTVGKIPPKPDDPDPVPPPPPVSEAPFQAPGFAVLIVHEVSEINRLPVRQRNIFTSADVHQYVNSKAVRLSDGQNFYRIWSDDHTASDLANVPRELRAAYNDTKELWDGNIPWIGINDGKGGGFAGPLPDTVEDTLKLLRKFGG